jgi:phenylalanyl-tRNA synthetase beta chain
MQLPYSWILELVNVDWPAKELADRLTLCGTVANASPFLEEPLDNIVVGQILEIEPIKNTDHLKKAMVSTGSETFQVVCGAPNAAQGQKIIFAKIGAKLKGMGELKKAKLRGVESFGMICSERELGLTDDHSGIMTLDDDAELGMAADEYLGVKDYILKFDLTPNRSDSLSAIGIARDVACLAGKEIKQSKFELQEISEKSSDVVKISIADTSACPRYAARVIRGVRIGSSPWWIKRKLILSGIRPISNVVDITNLVMLETGQPLHAFDFRQFGRREVLVRRAKQGERFTTLDGKEHELTPEVLLITDGEKGVAAAGVMGGLNSEVSSDTADILLESANFDPITVRRSRMKLGISSESSTRFEKGADPNNVTFAMDRAAYLMQQYAGGEILSGIIDCYPEKINPITIDLRPSRVNAILGTDISKERMIIILKMLQFRVKDKETLEVTVPTFRPDIAREIDLIEEIARIEGYEQIPSADRNIGPLYTPLHPNDTFRQLIRTSMTAQGFDEIYSSTLADPKLLTKIEPEKAPIAIMNPIAADFAVLQSSCLYSLLKAISNNFAQRNTDLRIFEVGKAFLRNESATGDLSPVEVDEIGIALSGKSDDQWFGKGRERDFYELKGAIDSFFEFARVPQCIYRPEKHPAFDDSLVFELIINEKRIGFAGLIKNEIVRAFDIKQTVYAAVLDFNIILNSRQPENYYVPLPKFPSAPRALAVIVDETINVADIISKIKEMGGELLEAVELFDLYRGKQVGEGKKSLAFSLVFRSKGRSLENEEVTEIYNNIIEYLKNNFKTEIREG